MNDRKSRAQAFEEYFSSLYTERWPRLREALLAEPRKQVLQNPFTAELQAYALDEASLAPVRHLDFSPGLHGADFCASPGGKLIATVFSVQGEGRWTANDLSPARVQRLKAVLHDCVPPEVLARITVYQGDASRWGRHYAEAFDRVLVDAPCSGERHLLAAPKELARWSLKATKGLAVRQHALLCAALDCVKPGGRIVYSTCSINPLENDGVIAKLEKSRAGRFERVKINEPLGEPTGKGHLILPDTTGCGPIYFSVLRKLERADG